MSARHCRGCDELGDICPKCEREAEARAERRRGDR